MRLFVPTILLAALASMAHAQTWDKMNYSSRRAVILNVCPSIKITAFAFGNVENSNGGRPDYRIGFEWSNAGNKDVTALEIVTLQYDPFNVPLRSTKTIFPGHAAIEYIPLKPGEKAQDTDHGLRGDAETYTGVVYVRAVRFVDGTIWTASLADVLKSIKAKAPDIVDPGPLAPARDKE